MKILEDIRTDIGVLDESFDNDILVFINLALTDLRMVGATNKTSISSDDSWESISDVLSDPSGSIRSYLTIKTKFLFDSPAPSMVGQHEKIISNHLSRIQQEVDLLLFNSEKEDKGGD